MADPLCHSLANIAQCIVIGVQYRLAPEHKFPAALEDAFAAIQWAASSTERFNGDPERRAVGGDSAGGNLAAAVAHMARDQHGPALMYQMLLYPSTDHNAFLDTTRQGFEYIVNPLARIRFHSECYLNNWEEVTNPLASPLLAPNFADLPHHHWWLRLSTIICMSRGGVMQSACKTPGYLLPISTTMV